jgi:hypothetical protein
MADGLVVEADGLYVCVYADAYVLIPVSYCEFSFGEKITLFHVLNAQMKVLQMCEIQTIVIAESPKRKED